MSVTPTTTSGASSTLHSQGHHAHHHRGRRLKHFLLPDGKKVHIALSPEEAESLRQRLNAISKDEPFDIVINASPEHLDALRRAHSHHAMRRETLRQTHGPAFDEFEDVRAELDALGDELHMLTDHDVALDASFSKYGYSAHLRTYDDTTPGSSTISGGFHDYDHVKKDWEAERRNGRVMKLYKKPVVRQYFHRGLLWRASGLAEVASFELFVDLLYVGILAINGDHASEETTGHELLRFCVTFIMSWKIWSDIALIVSILKWFETDDIVQRISVLFIMACLLGLTINMLEAFEKTYVQLVAFYLAARLFMAAYFIVLAGAVAMVRGMMITQSIIIIIPSALWIASIHVEMPLRLVPAWLAIFLDLCASIFIVFIIRRAKLFSKALEDWMERIFEFYPAVNIEHRVERTNAFVTLVFGYAVVAIIYQNAGSNGVNAFYGKAILGLIQSFSFNWIYFEIDGADLFAHAIRRNVTSALLWSSIHLPFIMAFVLGAAALSKLVVANDCPNASLETLTIFYMEKSEPDIPVGLRWFYCGGLGIALFCMGLISLSHTHKEAGGTRLKKVYRLSNRLGVCIVLFCLPLAHNLNSLQLISIVTGLVVWVLLLELWGVSCPKDSFFGEKNTCNYTARCKASKLQSAVKSGGVVHVKDLNDGAEKGMYELS